MSFGLEAYKDTDHLVLCGGSLEPGGPVQFRAFAISARNLVEDARQTHQCSPVVTAALGRLLCAGGMMSSMLKNDTDLLTLTIRGDGPVRSLTVTGDAQGNLKGYAANPMAAMPANAMHHLNVGGIVGNGTLTVIRDLGLKEPYSGTVPLRTGEIAEDIAYYYASSEQLPSAVGLGVLMTPENTVARAGGFILQMLPFAEESVLSRLEENLSRMPTVTTLLEEGYSPMQLLQTATEGLFLTEPAVQPVRYQCNCSRARLEKVLLSLGAQELTSLIEEDEAEGKETELVCEFCKKSYTFGPAELRGLLARAKQADQ